MNQSVIENLRKRLHQHHHFLRSGGITNFFERIKHFLSFLKNEPFFFNSIAILCQKYPNANVDPIFWGNRIETSFFEESVAIAYKFLEEIIIREIKFDEINFQSLNKKRPLVPVY